MKKEECGKVKIFISYHKEEEMIRSEILTPIHVGAAQSKVKLDMQRDDEGENISEKNDKFCELTAQYWAWKNVEAEYYGFMHYRRHFVFREIPNQEEKGGMTIFPRIDDAYKKEIGLSDSEIYDCIKEYDIILPIPEDVSASGMLTNEVQFSAQSTHHAVDFDLTCQTVLELYPEYKDAISEFRNGTQAYWCNMFIMRKELFFDYSQWLFRILEKAESKLDFTYYNEQEMRVLAFMAERLLSIYLIQLSKTNPDLKVKHLKVAFLRNTDKKPNIAPAFQCNNVAIAFSCNDDYMPILGVMLHSLLENSSSDHNYDILVMINKPELNSPGAIRNMEMLEKLVSRYPNAKIRFVDISGLLGNKEFSVRDHFTPETYFRLFLPQILVNYEKILYLDADMVVCHDVAELYETDLEGAVLGAARDYIISGSNKAVIYNKHDYMERLGIRNIYDYFQAGVLLIDLKKISEDGLCEKMLAYAATHECELVDQDVLNLFCQGRVKHIDGKWNVEVNNNAMQIAPYAPVAMWKEYQENRKNAYIYHFAGMDKPWNTPFHDNKAEIFWDAARKTPWYELILEDFIKYSVFSSRGIAKKNNSVLCELASLPDHVSRLVMPIMKAHAELSALGLSDAFAKAIKEEENNYQARVAGKHLLFYGAGHYCRQILLYFDQLGWDYPEEILDRAAKDGQRLFGIPVRKPDFASLNGREDVVCVITIENKSISSEVKDSFQQNGFTNVIENAEIMKILSCKLWLKLEEEKQ